jgi:large subunit ribosomal protein L5
MDIRLKDKYEKDIKPNLLEELGLKNSLQAPKIVKVVVNVGIGREGTDQKVVDMVTQNLKQITGQKPALRRARQAIAGFKLREGQPVGLVVTLRGQRMFDFLEKLTRIVFPRMRDFRGLSAQNFDKNGNYSIGFSEQIVFPEIDLGNATKNHGVEVTLVTSAKDKDAALKLLTLLGFKFKEGNTH